MTVAPVSAERLLQLAVDAIAVGYPPDRVLALLTTIRDATAVIAGAAIELFADNAVGSDAERLVALASRGRGLLAHGTGRLTIHSIGRLLGIDHDGDTTTALRQLLTADR